MHLFGDSWMSPRQRCSSARRLVVLAAFAMATPGAPDATGCPLCLAVRYTNTSDLLPADLHGVPTYAYPVCEIVAELLLLAMLWLIRDRLRERPGAAFLVAAIGYGAIRFVLSFLRQERMLLLGLQEAQLIAVLTSLAAAVVLAVRFGVPKSAYSVARRTRA